jgi:hypothetical protein
MVTLLGAAEALGRETSPGVHCLTVVYRRVHGKTTGDSRPGIPGRL